MDSITNKALIIAVGIFVTVAITSGILLSINKIKEIYQKVYETDTNITSRFDEFDVYDNTEKTGIDVANAMSKYGYPMVQVFDSNISANNSKDVAWWTDTEARINDNNYKPYSQIYISTIERNNDDSVTIKFRKK